MSPRWVNVIDASRARRLHRRWNNWRLVGIQLAKDQGREIPYQAECVRAAVTKYEAGKRAQIPGQTDYMEN